MPTLNWIGKEKVINHHNDVPFRLLEKTYSFGSEKSKNMIIHGDNLYVLKALLPRFEESIDCIYIDPPYNTGNEKWIYNDNVNDPRILKWLGQVVGDETTDLSRHDKWLCMMYPRIKLLQKLLSKNGVLFISIDEHEVHNLLCILNEIFGAQNIDILIWQKTDAKVDRNTNSKIINRTKNVHEYIVCAFKNKKETFFNKMMRMPQWAHQASNPDHDPRGPWQSGIISFEEGHKKEDKNSPYYYSITTPSGKVYTRMWYVLKEEWDALVADNRISFPKGGDGVPRLKTFQNEEKDYYMESLLNGVGTSSTAKDEIELLFGDRTLFDTPKPTKLIKELIRVSTNKKSIVLDCFAGSGTTGQAVLELNNEDKGDRTFIEVEMLDYAELFVAERIRKITTGFEGYKPLNGNFCFYEIGEPILLEDGNVNPKISESEVKKFIYYSEVHHDSSNANIDDPYMGTSDSAAYYVFYKKDSVSCLNFELLKTVNIKADSYVIYADTCTLSKSFMAKNHIVFKKIPRDIQKI